MSPKYDDAWVEKQLECLPPRRYWLTFREVSAFLGCGSLLRAMLACYNYGFRRGNSHARGSAGRKGG